VLESTLNRPFPEGKMTPTRLELGGVPCLLRLLDTKCSFSRAEAELKRWLHFAFSFYDHNSRLIFDALRRVHAQRSAWSNEPAIDLERFVPNIAFGAGPY
jgi:hypothetical protein